MPVPADPSAVPACSVGRTGCSGRPFRLFGRELAHAPRGHPFHWESRAAGHGRRRVRDRPRTPPL